MGAGDPLSGAAPAASRSIFSAMARNCSTHEPR